ncbi:FAD/NAD(P)-binding protein [Ancylobacter sp. TS-1]|uniref:FAD/NAD(P)-binding protein n=1 Tax=Ancylobacter sp. TS-1 TaxID=1850374 RepID=UPI001265CC0A|nr:FAD/NAD(P)-binding protein [Ancylobacter sp. TS-1]QFR33784.1 FAD-binding protein [Ancylobacter sp. TS-1]
MDAQPPESPRVAIIGGGFTGAVCAIELARAAGQPLSIDIIEPRATVGAGLAYGSCEPEHRINVPSDRMTVFPDEPDHFTRWLRKSGVWNDDPFGLVENGDHYSRRRDFAAYIADVVADTAAANPSGSTIRHRRAGALAIEPTGRDWRVRCDDAGPARYDRVVLSLTYGSPRFHWPLIQGAEALDHLVLDPWNWAAIKAIRPEARVVLIGTGLTTCDVVVSLRANGHTGPIHAISRRALTPRLHGEFNTDFDLFAGAPRPATALGLLRLVRSRVREVEQQGRSWHIVIDSLRRHLSTYWRTLPLSEQRRIAHRLRSFWDVHRFRIAPQVAALMESGRREGWLTVSAGRIHAVGRHGDSFALDWTPRGGERRILGADALVNCTGPDGDIARSTNPLLVDALAHGRVRPDALRIGLDTDADGRVIGASGEPVPGLWAAGPAARAVVGEATGVPEAAAHARLVARALATTLSTEGTVPFRFSADGSA